jgi:hypothetical protein
MLSSTSSNIIQDYAMINDKWFRSMAISGCQKLEKAINEGLMPLERPIIDPIDTPKWGMKLRIQVSRPHPEKPMVFSLQFSFNRVEYEQWVANNRSLTSSPMTMYCRGITVGIQDGKPEFSVVSNYGGEFDRENRIALDLMDKTEEFVAFRDAFCQEDWVVAYNGGNA